MQYMTYAVNHDHIGFFESWGNLYSYGSIYTATYGTKYIVIDDNI